MKKRSVTQHSSVQTKNIRTGSLIQFSLTLSTADLTNKIKTLLSFTYVYNNFLNEYVDFTLKKIFFGQVIIFYLKFQ